MPVNLDTYLGVHATALKLRSQRTEVLASNLANIDTPGYRARDIDFKSVLAAANGGDSSSVQMTATRPGHIGAATANGTVTPELKYRTPLAPSLDGNTVDAQLEQAAFVEKEILTRDTDPTPSPPAIRRGS